MQVEFPSCQWPAVLDKRGPLEDPSILFTGAARIGDIALQVIAIRVKPALRWTPDYKASIPEDRYQVSNLDSAMETFLEEFEYIVSDFEELLGEFRPSILDLETGPYMVWVVPSSFGT
jgi:hypothetical protein